MDFINNVFKNINQIENKIITLKIIDFIISAGLSFSTFINEEFQILISYLRPSYSFVSLPIFIKTINEYYDVFKRKLIQLIDEETRFTQIISVTTDSWTKFSNHRFLSTTISYTMPDFTIRSYAIAVQKIDGSLSGPSITTNLNKTTVYYAYPRG